MNNRLMPGDQGSLPDLAIVRRSLLGSLLGKHKIEPSKGYETVCPAALMGGVEGWLRFPTACNINEGRNKYRVYKMMMG